MTDPEWEKVRSAGPKTLHDPAALLEDMITGERPEPRTADELAWEIIVEAGRGNWSGRLGDATTDTTDLAPQDLRRFDY